MMPRAPLCDDDRCDYDETGRWQHHRYCSTQDPWAEHGMAAETAREDGYGRPYGVVVQFPAQPERRSA